MDDKHIEYIYKKARVNKSSFHSIIKYRKLKVMKGIKSFGPS